MATRELTDRDEPELERFVLMAAFSPDAPIPGGARAMTHVRRWLDGWSALEAGVCWEEDDCVLGAAWARRVEPILVRTALGQAVPEVVIAVDPDRRGRGIGRALMEGLVASTEEAGEPGLCLSVSAKNASAVRLYERVGFVPIGERRTHLITMVLELEDQVERRFCSAREQESGRSLLRVRVAVAQRHLRNAAAGSRERA